MTQEPLALPAGSVHAGIALLVTIAVCMCIILSIPIPDWFQMTFKVVIGYYFIKRELIDKIKVVGK